MKFWASAAFTPTPHYLPLARAVEAAGFEGMALGDHLLSPRSPVSRYPYSADGRPGWLPDTPFPDVWVLAGALAAVTTTLKFASTVYVAPARDIATVAKSVSTAAVLSDNRVIFGVGAGWSADEFAVTGQSFVDRGARLEEMLGVLNELWTTDWVEHRGKHYEFGAMQLSPRPSRPVPVWVGGYLRAAIRRAAELAQGWVGVAPTDERGIAVINALTRARDRCGRTEQPFDIVLSLPYPVTPEVVERWAGHGVTGLIVRPWAAALDPELRGLAATQADSLERKLEAINRFHSEVIEVAATLS